MKHTNVMRCSVNELTAIDRAIKGPYQYELLAGLAPWGGSDKRRSSQYALLERLRRLRGLKVIEKRSGKTMHVTISGSLTEDGFRKKI